MAPMDPSEAPETGPLMRGSLVSPPPASAPVALPISEPVSCLGPVPVPELPAQAATAALNSATAAIRYCIG